MGLTLPGAGSGGSSVASPSTLGLTVAHGSGVTIPHGLSNLTLDLSGLAVSDGEAWWGAGTALPLGATFDSGDLHYPQDDTCYDIYVKVNALCDVTDIGKRFRVFASGNFMHGRSEVLVGEQGNGNRGIAHMSLFDIAWKGDGNSASCQLSIDTSELTVDITAEIVVLVASRTAPVPT